MVKEIEPLSAEFQPQFFLQSKLLVNSAIESMLGAKFARTPICPFWSEKSMISAAVQFLRFPL
jgi:hypothetical protein